MDGLVYSDEMRKKRVLQINPVLRPSTSTGRIMQEIADLVQENGWESYLAYSKGRDGLRISTSQVVPVGDLWSVAWHGVMTRLFDRHGLASQKATERFIQRIREIAPDVIHIHNIHGYFLNYPMLFDFLSKSNIPVVWTVHDCWLYTGHCYYYDYAGCDKWQSGCGNCPQRRKFPASWFYDRSARNWLDKQKAFTSIPRNRLLFAPVSKWLKSEMEKSFLKDYECRVVHNGIDTHVFALSEDTDRVKKQFGLVGKHIILGVASIWSEEKGLKDFCKLSSLLSEDKVIVLVGVTKKQKSFLNDKMIGIERTENISQMAQLYAAADVFVNPTWQDNFPTVNMEAISCGTPVITYRTGGSVEVITEKTGVIVEQGDVKQLAQEINKIVLLGKTYFQGSCREYAINNFSKESKYKFYLKIYEEMLARNHEKI